MDALLEQLQETPLTPHTHDVAMQCFNKYALTGGMPEIVKQEVVQNDIYELSEIYESLCIRY